MLCSTSGSAPPNGPAAQLTPKSVFNKSNPAVMYLTLIRVHGVGSVAQLVESLPGETNVESSSLTTANFFYNSLMNQYYDFY